MRDSTVDSSYRLQLLTPTLTIWYAATDSNWCDKTKLADRHMITLAQRYRNAKRKHNGWHKENWFASKIINLLCRLCYHFFASPKQVTKVDLKKNFKKRDGRRETGGNQEEDNMLSNLPASSFSRQPSKPTSSLPPKSRSEFDDARPAPENPRSIVLFKLLRDSNLSRRSLSRKPGLQRTVQRMLCWFFSFFCQFLVMMSTAARRCVI